MEREIAPFIVWVGEVTVDYGYRPSDEETGREWFEFLYDCNWDRDYRPQLRPERKDASTTGIQTAKYGCLYLGRDVTDEEALVEITERRVKPATELETIHFGKRYPGQQRLYPIGGLGSFLVLGGKRLSPKLIRGAREGLIDWSAGPSFWSDDYRFLVRE